MNRTLTFEVTSEYDGERVVKFLREAAGLSYRLVRSLKQIHGSMLADGVPVRSIDRLKTGMTLTIHMPLDGGASVEPVKADFDVIYEDDDILVLNKPAGLAMHPTHNHQGDTLANAVAYYLTERGRACVFRAAGRLDKNTSGLVVCSLNKHAAAKLSGSFEKEYIAVAQGAFDGNGTIDAPIIRPDPMKTLRAVGENGEPAVTHWKSLGTKNGYSLLHITLETGRTHQIRVHFASLGAPLAGDEMYGGKTDRIHRHALHCAELHLMHPVTGEKMHFSAPLPEDMQSLADWIMKKE
ncbi:MAG TPA: RluA family pseudouridine synthase [Ruminococcaceae bacterium]|nr:RluA family pseudouridine synthase [Oscillospiraceae bacterium]